MAFIIAMPQNKDYDDYKKQAEKDILQYKEQARKEFNDYRDEANAEFAKFMESPWTSIKINPPIPIPDKPSPVTPPIKKDKDGEGEKQLPYDEIIEKPIPQPAPRPVTPIPDIQPTSAVFSFAFYKTPCKIRLGEEHRFKLASSTEKDVSKIWSQLSHSKYNPVIQDCIRLRSVMKLSDWAYIDMLKTLTESFFGRNNPDEATVMQFFLLTQSGYKVRIALKADNRLALLIPSNYEIYEYKYFVIGGIKYFLMDKNVTGNSCNIFTQSFPGEKLLSIQIYDQPLLAVDLTPKRTLSSKRYPNVRADVRTNKNLIAFYDNYPRNSNWDTYSKASLSEELKRDLYPALKAAITGKNEAEAANILINFVQTAFEYQTDDEQFGYERPFFGDETIFYPYSDCEDRAILFSILIRELMGLDAVLLHYPGHLAAAVKFTSDIRGDYLVVDGKKFVICDPTYINANIGNAMPQYKTSSCRVIKL